jgi:UDP-N-acetylglucosamine:LPS N-acetylglucosamine transferase
MADSALLDNGQKSPPKAMLVCSSGGHLLQLHRLKPWWVKRERVWVTFDMPDSRSLLAGEDVRWAYYPDRPSVIVSTGAGVAFPFFLVARLLRIKTVYVEVYDRIDVPTLTGRLCHPLASRFLLQWEAQKRFYPRGEVIGRLF